MEHFSGTGGTEVGPTIQEADRFYLVEASARDHNDRSANGHVPGSERGERGGQTASHEGMLPGQVNCDAAGSTKRKQTGYKKPGWVPNKKKVPSGLAQLQLQTLPYRENELRRQSDEIVDEMNKGRACRGAKTWSKENVSRKRKSRPTGDTRV